MSFDISDPASSFPAWIGSIVEFPRITDGRGNLTVVEGDNHLPFDIARVYYIYNVPSGIVRAAHAHRTLQQIMIAVAGSFNLVLDNGTERLRVRMCRPDRGLLLHPMIWREAKDFSSDAVCLVLASSAYDEEDYIRDYGVYAASVR